MSTEIFWKLRRVAHWLPKRFTSRGLILMYHRIAEKDVDPFELCVTPKHFVEHLEILRKYANPISLGHFARVRMDGEIPDRAVAVTFDDGYASNLHSAKSLLERYHIPATVFVTTGYLEKNQEFWWDDLDRLLLQPGRLPESLRLNIRGTTHHWELGTAVDYTEDDYRRDCDGQSGKVQPGSRLSFYYTVWQQLQPLQDKQRQKALDGILTWTNAKPVVRPSHKVLIPEELFVLEEGGLMEVGAHSVTHPLLPSQLLDFQRNEIQRSKAYLEQVLEHPVTSFAYPFGANTKETVALVREAGFTCACSTIEETLWQYSDSFQLPRFEVRNWTGEEFKQRLSRWFRFQ